MLIISVKGESYDPSMSYVEEMIKIPLEELKLFDQETPAFRNVEIVSRHHASQSKEENEPASVGIDQSERLIAFEMRWIVNTTNLRGAYANRMKKEFALNE